MASRLLLREGKRGVKLYPSLSALLPPLQPFSSSSGGFVPVVRRSEMSCDMSGLSAPDPRFPLPGQIGTKLDKEETPALGGGQPPLEVLPLVLGDEASSTVMSMETEGAEVEVCGYDCPTLVRRDLQSLFPQRDIVGNFTPLTLLTLTHHTQHDMSSWSEGVEVEREGLIAQFVDKAKIMCEMIEKQGFWADFIDPTSGMPYRGPHTNATLFETDERYKKFGLDIEDLGCCKVIRHPRWGTNMFCGTLFTSAPLDSEVMRGLVGE